MKKRISPLHAGWLFLALAWLGPTVSNVQAQIDPVTGQRTDYYDPMRVSGQPDSADTRWRHVTICNESGSWVWKRPFGKIGEAIARVTNADRPPPEGKSYPAQGRSHGTDGSVEIFPRTTGESNLDITTDGLTIHLLVHVIHNTAANRGHRGVI